MCPVYVSHSFHVKHFVAENSVYLRFLCEFVWINTV